MTYIYFDENKEAYMSEIENPTAIIDIELWKVYCDYKLGEAYDIIDGQFVQLWSKEYCIRKSNAKQRISELKILLATTDYKTQKYIEGQLSDEEWAIAKAERQAWRDEIRDLENLTPY
jgi:hypothetical protein